jgi:hypothetical protein
MHVEQTFIVDYELKLPTSQSIGRCNGVEAQHYSDIAILLSINCNWPTFSICIEEGEPIFFLSRKVALIVRKEAFEIYFYKIT